MLDNCSFKGFRPEHPLVPIVNSTVAWLLVLLPEDALATAEFERIDRHFRCRIEINSSIGHFRADALEGSAMDALDAAVSQIKLGLNTPVEALVSA